MANAPELGFGTYRAEHVSGAVILHANGETPSPGYKVWLQEAMIDVYPPRGWPLALRPQRWKSLPLC